MLESAQKAVIAQSVRQPDVVARHLFDKKLAAGRQPLKNNLLPFLSDQVIQQATIRLADARGQSRHRLVESLCQLVGNWLSFDCHAPSHDGSASSVSASRTTRHRQYEVWGTGIFFPFSLGHLSGRMRRFLAGSRFIQPQ